MPEYRLIMTGVISVCALAVTCSVSPEVDRIVSTVLTVLAVGGGLALVGFVGWLVYMATTDAPDDEFEYPPAAQLEYLPAAHLERETVR